MKINTFWVELAKHFLEKSTTAPFLSSNFIYCAANHTEMLAALSVLSLPFEAASHKYSPIEGKGVKIETASDVILFSKEIKEGQSDLKVDILVAQRFFDPKNR